MRDDLRQAFRNLRRQPGFAAVAILTLAFGISVNVTLFGTLSAFFLRPLPIQQPDRLVYLLQRSDLVNMPYGHSYPDFLDYRSAARAFTDMAAFTPQPAHISAHGRPPERTWIEVVSPNYFALAGTSPAFGAFPAAGTLTGNTAPTVVLSYRYWQRRFGGDPGVVGQAIALNGHGFVVSGIAPATFTGLSWAMAVSAWVPAGAIGMLNDGGDRARDERGNPMWRVMGRLAPGRTIADARAEVDTIGKRLAADYPAQHKDSRPVVVPENRARPDPAIAGFLPIFAAVFTVMVAIVLLIACANVANLMLSRALARQRDLVIRSALGAGRFRLIRLQIVESLILASVAGAIGFVLARWAGGALSQFVPAGDIPMNQHHELDWRIYVFAIAVSIVTGVITGLWPARKATRFDLVDSLKDGSAATGTSRHALRNLLVVGQVTLSLVVLASAGLFLHSLREMRHTQLGFRPDGLLMLSMDLGLQQYSDDRGRAFIDELLRRTEALPGVTSATASVRVPFDYAMQFADVTVDGSIPGSKDNSLEIGFTSVAPKFLDTLGTPLLRGRTFDSRDDERAPLVAIVNQAMAQKLWPGQDPVGRRFRFSSRKSWTEVVGLTGDGKYMMLAEPPRPYFYVPLSQRYDSPVTVFVRSASDPAALATPVQRLLNEMDPDLPVFNVRTMDAHLRDSLFALMPLRVGAWMAGVQGAIALLLAIMGLYAVVSYAVARRTREIGVRMALGADEKDVLRLVVREGMWLSLVGIVIGLGLSLVVGVVLSSVLFRVASVDVPVLAGVTVLLLGVSALACYVPARRATHVDPLVSLRSE